MNSSNACWFDLAMISSTEVIFCSTDGSLLNPKWLQKSGLGCWPLIRSSCRWWSHQAWHKDTPDVDLKLNTFLYWMNSQMVVLDHVSLYIKMECSITHVVSNSTTYNLQTGIGISKSNMSKFSSELFLIFTDKQHLIMFCEFTV